MKVTVRLPSDETVAFELRKPDLDELKQRIEIETTIPASNQELQLEGVPLSSLTEGVELTLDLIVRVGRRYAIASASLPGLPDTETFRPAQSIEQARDFEAFLAASRHCRFSDNRPLEKTADISRAVERANARLGPYRTRADARRARLKELCARLDDGPLVAMTFNSPYAQLFENWHRSCLHHGIDVRSRTVTFPMDPQSESLAQRLGYETFCDPGSYGDFEQRPDVRFGDRQWVDCLFMKNAVLGDMLAAGFDVLFQDVDMIWRRDPLSHLEAKANRECWDFMFQQAGMNAIFQPLYYNSGFVYARSNDFSRLTWERVLDNLHYCYVYGSQQVPVNIIMNAFRERGLRTCGLDQRLVVNGHLIPAEPKECDVDLYPQAFAIHFNWTDGLASKLDRLRKHALWYLDSPALAQPGLDPAASAPASRSRHGEHAMCMVSHRLRCIYLAIAKNASSTVKAELRRLDADVEECRCTDVSVALWREYKTFTFLRDSVARVLSAYQEISMRLDGKTDDDLPFTKLPPGLDRFDAFLDRIEAGFWDPHIRPQADLIGGHPIDFCGRVETFQADFACLLDWLGMGTCPPLPQRRSRIGRARDYGYAEHLLWEADLAPQTVQRIRTIYARDEQLLDEFSGEQRGQKGPGTNRWSEPVIRPLRR